MEIFFISDLHIGHKSILKFSGDYRAGTTIDEHDEWIKDSWNKVVQKRDLVYVLGDVCFNREKLPMFSAMKGNKILIRGNHDEFMTKEYLNYFTEVYGLYKRYGIWMSHAPIHPDELRNKPNIHGHVHHKTIQDPRYFNACVENLKGTPVPLYKVREHFGIGV